MENVNERLELIERQKELEEAMKRLGGARVTEEQELHAIRQKLRANNEVMLTPADALRAMRCSLADFARRGLDRRSYGDVIED